MSEVTGSTQVTLAPHPVAAAAAVMLAGQFVITGSSSSVIVIVNDVSMEFPLASVSAYVCVVTPTGKISPVVKPDPSV